MTKTDLREMVASGESSGVEFTRHVTDDHSLATHLIAFANLHGGRVLLGVDDDGSIRGLSRRDPPAGDDGDDTGRRTYRGLEEWVAQACRDKIRPEIIPRFEIVPDVTPGRDVAVVQVERGWTVHHLWHNQHRTYYVRVGSLNREASPEELARLFQQRDVVRPEHRPVSGTSISDLDRRRLVDYFERVREQEAPGISPSDAWRRETEAWAKGQDEVRWRFLAEDREREWREEQEAAWQALLVNTEFLHEDAPHPATIAGLVLFGRNPSRFLPQAKIDAVAYPGTEKDYEARERRTLRGPTAGGLTAHDRS